MKKIFKNKKLLSAAFAFILTSAYICAVCFTSAFTSLPSLSWIMKVYAAGDSYSSISAGGNHSAFIKSDGSLWMWGWNVYGQLGDGTTHYRKQPVKIMDDVVQVSAGGWHTLALKSDGSVWAWGYNSSGQLGDNSLISKSSPVKIMDDIIQISAGSAYSMAIKSDGSLWAWGTNNAGQLGDGTRSMRMSPVKIMDGVIKISLGITHSMAIKSDGSLWAWGNNDTGQLGDRTTIEKRTPWKIMDNVLQVSAGEWHTAAIKTDNSLWVWGNNSIGQLGIGGNTHNTYKPIPSKLMEDVIQVSAGGSHTVAIKSDGSVLSWGRNGDGQLGDGTFLAKFVPAIVQKSDDIVQISAGYANTIAVKNDGTFWGWGYNGYGHLDYGVETQMPVAVKIADDVTPFAKNLIDSANPINSLYIYDSKINTDLTGLNIKFKDISNKSQLMQDSINVLASKNIIIGTSVNSFNPDKPVTRAEAAVFIMRILDYCNYFDNKSADLNNNTASDYFTDVKKSDWFYNEVYNSDKYNIINGVTDTSFAPSDKITRAEIFNIAAQILKTYSSCEILDSGDIIFYINKFTDKHQILEDYPDNKSYKEHDNEVIADLALVIKEGLVFKRIDNRLALEETMTRGDFAVLLYGLFEKLK